MCFRRLLEEFCGLHCMVRGKTEVWIIHFLTRDACYIILILALPAMLLLTQKNVVKVALKSLCKLLSTYIQLLCVCTYILTGATNRSRGIIVFAQFGCPPKSHRKSLLKTVLNWTIKRCPEADFTEAVCIVWHLLLFFYTECILLHVCGGMHRRPYEGLYFHM